MLEVAVRKYNDSFDYTEMVRARDARQHEVYLCPYCGVKVSRRSNSNGKFFFARLPGEPPHQNNYCKYIVKNNYTINEFDYDAFFANVFKETHQKQPGTGLLVDNDDEPGGFLAVGTDGPDGLKADIDSTETAGEDGGDQKCSGVPENSESIKIPLGRFDEEVIDKTIPQKRVASLADLYRCGLHELPPDTKLPP